MKSTLIYFIIIQVFPKDSIDDSYKYIVKSNENREYTLFMNHNKSLGDTIYYKYK